MALKKDTSPKKVAKASKPTETQVEKEKPKAGAKVAADGAKTPRKSAKREPELETPPVQAEDVTQPIAETEEDLPPSEHGISEAEHAEIYCAFERNFERVNFGKGPGGKDRIEIQDNGGYRIGVVSDKRWAYQYFSPNQVDMPTDPRHQAHNPDAIWYARLKAVEWAIEWFPKLKSLTIVDQFGEVNVTNRKAKAPQYRFHCNRKATEAGFTVNYKQVLARENKARRVAAVVNGTHCYTSQQKESYQAYRQKTQRSFGGGSNYQQPSSDFRQDADAPAQDRDESQYSRNERGSFRSNRM